MTVTSGSSGPVGPSGPAGTPSVFTAAFEAANQLAAGTVTAWVCEPGMRFATLDSWWGRRRPRPQPHEGLDLHRYRRRDERGGGFTTLDEHSVWPAPWSGTVVAVFDDFLGRSVFVVHPLTDGRDRLLCSVFGHTNPHPDVAAGVQVAACQPLGRVASTEGRITAAHLHWSLGWCDGPPGPDLFDWPALAVSPRFELVDPAPHLGVPVLDVVLPSE